MKSLFTNHSSWLHEYECMRPFDEKPPTAKDEIDTISLNEENRVNAQWAFEQRKAKIAERVEQMRRKREEESASYRKNK